DLDLFLRAGHRVIAPAAILGSLTLRKPTIRGLLGIAEAVVGIQLALLLLGEMPIRIQRWRILDLLLGERHRQLVARFGSIAQRYKMPTRAEQPRLHERELRLPGVVVDVDLVNSADLLAAGIAELSAFQRANGLSV